MGIIRRLFKQALSRLNHLNQDGERGTFRIRRILMSAASTFGAKGVNLLVMLASVPLTYGYLGEERFGLLMLILSLVMLMSFADLGLGYGLLNKIASFDVSGNLEGLKQAVSSTFLFLSAVGAALLILFMVSYSSIAWYDLFNVESVIATGEAGAAVLVFACCFCLTLPFTIVAKLQSGFQENHINQLWEASGNIFGLGALVLAVFLEAGVPVILLAIYGSQCLFVLINFGYQFIVKRPHLFPSLMQWSTRIFKDIFRDALMICSLQVSSIFINAIDSVLIARYVDPKAVAAYAIGYRLFSIFILPVQAFLTAVLPAFNDAIASRDYNWIQSGLRKGVLGVSFSSVALGVLFVFTGNLIIGVWIAPEASLTVPLLIAFGAYVMFQNVSSLLFSIMMSPVFLKRLFILFGLASLAVIVLKLVMINSFHFSSVLWATMIGSSIIFVIPGFVHIYSRLATMAKEKPAVPERLLVAHH